MFSIRRLVHNAIIMLYISQELSRSLPLGALLELQECDNILVACNLG